MGFFVRLLQRHNLGFHQARPFWINAYKSLGSGITAPLSSNSTYLYGIFKHSSLPQYRSHQHALWVASKWRED